MKQLLPVFLFIFSSFLAVAQAPESDGKGADAAFFQQEKNTLKTEVEVFPNPAIENIFVKIVTSDLENVEFELFNIIGTTLKIDYEKIESNYYRIRVKELPSGYYLLMVKDPVKRFNQAFKIHKINK